MNRLNKGKTNAREIPMIMVHNKKEKKHNFSSEKSAFAIRGKHTSCKSV